MMGPAFVKESKELIVRARQEAVRLGSAETGTEHLLLALAASESAAGRFLRERGVTADRVAHYADPLTLDAPLLATLGIDADAVQEHLDASFGRERWRRVFGCRPRRLSAEATRAIQATVADAKAARSRRIDPTIVLAAVLREGRQAGLVLRRLGHEPAKLALELRAAR